MANKKRKMKRKNNNKLLFAVVLCVIAVILLGFAICRINGKIKCEKVHEYDVGVEQLNEFKFAYRFNDLASINVTKTITINDDLKENELSYLQIIDESLKNVYKQKGIVYTSKIKNDKLIVFLKYADKNKYVLNDSDIIISKDGVSVNIMTKDNNNGRVNIDLSKKYSKDKIRNIMKKSKYICK